jgi:putative intracellular protease/amidase
MKTIKHSLALLLLSSIPLMLCAFKFAQPSPSSYTGSTVMHSALQSEDKKLILVILSANNKLRMNNGTTIKTGYFLDELAVPAQALVAAGYTLEVATPNGLAAPMDENSNSAAYFHNDSIAQKNALDFVKAYPAFNKPLKLKDVAQSDLKKYSAVFIPGGRAPMTDLMQNSDLGKILRYVHQENIITALICHGPVALTAALPDGSAYRKALVSHNEAMIKKFGKDWIYSGYQMTIFTNAEEDDALKESEAKLPFYVSDGLQFAGGVLKHADENWKPFVIRDRELITGQNPASDHALAKALLEALNTPKR